MIRSAARAHSHPRPESNTNRTLKLTSAVAALLVAAVFLAWNAGWIGASASPAELAAIQAEDAKTPETRAAEQRARQQQQDLSREVAKSAGTVIAGP